MPDFEGMRTTHVQHQYWFLHTLQGTQKQPLHGQIPEQSLLVTIDLNMLLQ